MIRLIVLLELVALAVRATAGLLRDDVKRWIGSLLLAALFIGCAPDVGLTGPSDPCDPSAPCAWGEDGAGVPRCCADGPNCLVWYDGEGGIVCSPYHAGETFEIATGAIVFCAPNGGECRP